MTTTLVNKFFFSSLAEDLSLLSKNNESKLIEREITLFKKGEKTQNSLCCYWNVQRSSIMFGFHQDG